MTPRWTIAGVRRRPPTRLLLALFMSIASLLSHAQQAAVQTSRGPHYVGIPIDIQVVADGFDESPQPQIDGPQITAGSLSLLGVSPNINTSIQVINGQMTQSKTVRFVYRLSFVGDAPGSVEFGAFEVEQNGQRVRTRPFSLNLQAVPQSGDQRIELDLPNNEIWLGQRATVKLRWWLLEEMGQRVVNHQVRVPLFDEGDKFRFEDEPARDERNVLNVYTSQGPLQLPAQIERRRGDDGRDYLVLTAERTLIPLQSGDLVFDAPSIVTEEAVSWRRGFFGRREAARTRRLRALGNPTKFTIKALPSDNRPASFAGAVGQGFSLSVSADRSVLKSGDPLTLSLYLSGDSDLSTLSLPALEALGLNSADFKLPSETSFAGQVVDAVQGSTKRKRFDINVRVLHDGVNAIPALQYAWFDPQLGRYQTTESEPIALSVSTAQKVGTENVVRATADESPQAPSSAAQSQSASASPSGSNTQAQRRIELSGADLSIETSPDQLNRTGNKFTAVIVAALYAIGFGALVIGIWRQRRSRADPRIEQQRQHLRQIAKRIEQSNGIEEITQALRELPRLVPQIPRADLEDVLRDCDALAFRRPNGNESSAALQASGIDSELRARASNCAQQALALVTKS